MADEESVWATIGRATDREPEASMSPGARIRHDIERTVREGRVPPGTRLPTVRSLADRLGVAPGTVAKAYRELEAAGVIETRGRSGSFVGTPAGAADAALEAAAREYAAVARSVGADEASAVEALLAAMRGGAGPRG